MWWKLKQENLIIKSNLDTVSKIQNSYKIWFKLKVKNYKVI